jgi:predicted RNA-binding protein (virulence factor B family)
MPFMGYQTYYRIVGKTEEGKSPIILSHGGRINLNDKSPAEDIYDTFGVSKKTFKKGVGDLYKKRLITLHEDGIALADS